MFTCSLIYHVFFIFSSHIILWEQETVPGTLDIRPEKHSGWDAYAQCTHFFLLLLEETRETRGKCIQALGCKSTLRFSNSVSAPHF